MKILADKNIPYLKGIAEQYGEVRYLAGNEFSHKTIYNADTLIVRTVTYLGKEILENTDVRLICSATIGYDHIDTKYCDKKGIIWKNAPGCNSGSVMQYIISSLVCISRKKGFDLRDKTIGIIGVGNVGKKVAEACKILGMRVLLNDPPRQIAENSGEFVDMYTIQKECDIISFHTPLIKEGKYKTYHLADKNFFKLLNKQPVIINSARGGIIDTKAIKEAACENKISGIIIDCWENEPYIDREYLNMADLATPHIAGYSADGKANATRISLEHLAEFWNMSKAPVQQIKIPEIQDSVIDLDKISSGIEDAILFTYNPVRDWKKLMKNPDKFTELRENYPVRREYPAYTVINADYGNGKMLESLGFVVK